MIAIDNQKQTSSEIGLNHGEHGEELNGGTEVKSPSQRLFLRFPVFPVVGSSLKSDNV